MSDFTLCVMTTAAIVVVMETLDWLRRRRIQRMVESLEESFTWLRARGDAFERATKLLLKAVIANEGGNKELYEAYVIEANAAARSVPPPPASEAGSPAREATSRTTAAEGERA